MTTGGFDSGIRKFSGLKYRVQHRQIEGIWMQRHVWYPSSASPWLKDIFVEDWIKGLQHDTNRGQKCENLDAIIKEEN